MIRTLVGALVPNRQRAETDGNAIQETPIAPDDYLDVDEALNLLSNSRRRHIIDAVAETPGLDRPLEVADLAADVAEREGTDWRSAYVSHRHYHLDCLGEADVLAVNWETNTVRRGPMFDQAQAYLEDGRQRFQEPLDARAGGVDDA